MARAGRTRRGVDSDDLQGPAGYGGGLLIAESLAAALVHGRALYFGTDRNVGRLLSTAAGDLGRGIHVLAS